MQNILIENNNIDLTLFESEENEFKIQFSNKLSFDEILELTDKIFEWEESHDNLKKVIHVDFKGIETDNLVKMYKHYLDRETLINSYMITNINVLVNGYNTLDDSLFESEIVYETDLEQLLDLKLDLKDDIKAFQTKLSKWFIAGIKSIHKVEYTYLDNFVEMPNIFSRIISTSNLLTLSQVFDKSDSFSTEDLPLVKDSYPIVMSAVATSALANKLIQELDLNIQ